MNTYFEHSKSPFYSILASLPLLFLYEIFTVFLSQSHQTYFRNQADIWLKELFGKFGMHGPFSFVIVLIIITLTSFWLKKKNVYLLRFSYFIFMILESLLFASVLGLVLSFFTNTVLALSATNSNIFSTQILLAIGAGIYEELFFRVFLFGITAVTFIKVLKLGTVKSYLVAAILASLAFSYIHHLNEAFEWYNFLFRFFFGLIFCVIYLVRGYGIAAWTHVFYNVFIFIRF